MRESESKVAGFAVILLMAISLHPAVDFLPVSHLHHEDQ